MKVIRSTGARVGDSNLCRQCGHDKKACVEVRTAYVWELLFGIMPVMDEDGNDMEKKETINGFEVREAFRELWHAERRVGMGITVTSQ